jgi:O-antigen/teichoic acid export membrane protein
MSAVNTNSAIASETGLHIRGSLLARNTVLNVAGQVIPLLVGVATMPYVIRHLGPDRFGLLSIAWMVVGFFAFFDLGIGPATTKFVAELLGKGETEKLPALVWTALVTQSSFGLLAGILVAAASPTLVDRLLKIPPGLRPDAHWVFLILAVSFPINFAVGSLRGVLAAAQRFDLLNAIGIPSSALGYLIPAGALALGFGLRGIVLLLVVSQIVGLGAYFLLCLRLYPALGRACAFHRSLVRRLLVFGGWVSVTSTLAPILNNFEKFVAARLLSVGALTFYMPCYSVISKVTIFPSAFAAALFPAFSYCGPSTQNSHLLKKLALYPLKYILLIMVPVTITFLLFGDDILRIWLGADFAHHSATVFRILALVFFIHAFAYLPLASINGLGHPEWKAKLDLMQAPLFMALSWILTLKMGLEGVALAKLCITVVDTICLFIMAKRLVGFSFRELASPPLIKSFAVACIPTVCGLSLVIAPILLTVKLVLFLCSLALYCFVTWSVAFDDQDRLILSTSLRTLGGKRAL